MKFVKNEHFHNKNTFENVFREMAAIFQGLKVDSLLWGVMTGACASVRCPAQ